MNEQQFKQTEQKITELQTRVKALAAKRDTVIRNVGFGEQKLKESYDKLRELGVTNPESLSVKQLNALADQLQEQLAAAVTDLTQKVEEGERLLVQV